MIYDFDKSPSRQDTDSIKWKLYDKDVLPFWVADMDFISPEPVIRVLRERVNHGFFGYPIEKTELIHAIINRMDSLYSWKITPQDVLLLPEVVVGFNLACHATALPGEGMLIQTPVYPPFFSAPNNARLLKQEMELTNLRNGKYEVDFQAFEAAINSQTRLFLLCNPHNPVGRVYKRDELEKMAEICLRHNIVICSDEIHSDLVFKGNKHIPIATLDPSIAYQTITLISPSKTYNIAGLKCSVCIVQNQELKEKILQSTQGLVGHLNLMGMTAALAAYTEGQEWLDQVLIYLENNRDFLVDYINKNLPGIFITKPEGTYLAWLDCRKSGISGNPSEFFLEKARVALNDGEDFGKGGEGFVRFNFACPRDMLVEGLERMRLAMMKMEE